MIDDDSLVMSHVTFHVSGNGLGLFVRCLDAINKNNTEGRNKN